MEENKKPENPSAFPVMHSIDGNWIKEPKDELKGMTLRDYFAGLAMQAIITGLWTDADATCLDDGMISCRAYEYSDAMLKQRELC